MRSEATKAAGLRHYEKNVVKIKARAKAWNAANPQVQKDWYMRNREQIREKNLKHFYGLTLADFDEMFEAQGGKCAACQCDFDRVQFSRNRPNVDHDHETGRVRGLLCNACNRAAGLLRDDPALLDSLAAYLRKGE